MKKNISLVILLILGILIGICISKPITRLIKGTPEYEYVGMREDGYGIIRNKDKTCVSIAKNGGGMEFYIIDPIFDCHVENEKYIGKTPEGDEIYGNEENCYSIDSKTKKMKEYGYITPEKTCKMKEVKNEI